MSNSQAYEPLIAAEADEAGQGASCSRTVAPLSTPGSALGELLVRVARREDVGAMAALAKAFAQLMCELGDDGSLQLDAIALERDGFGASPAFDGLVAERDGAVVGYLLHHAGYDTDAACRLLFVVDLFVAPHARGSGCGTALMQAARDAARAAGARQLVWTIDRRNRDALDFYTHFGAQPIDTLALMCIDA